MSHPKKKYVAVGTGGRIPMFIDPIAQKYSEYCDLLAFCDLSQVRMDYHRNRLAEQYGYQTKIATYLADEFDKMIDEIRPDVVIVCTQDSLHHEFIIRAVEKGCDVICEKPITVDADKARAIDEAVKRTGRQVRVTFNVRWMPGATKVKELIESGVIGRIRHVNLEYLLNTQHGADYFRRWHSEKASSGGLLVHKSTHHFDLINWLVNSVPETVYALGDLVFYGKKNATERGEAHLTTYERYSDCPDKAADPFYLDLDSGDSMKKLYRDAEGETGYIRDRNVFRDGIDIEDSMSLAVRYRNGVMFNYSLNAFCPKEGYRICLSGDKGRIEFEEVHASHIISGKSDSELAQEQGTSYRRLTVQPLFKQAYEVEIPTAEGAHGGGDPLLQEQIFSPLAPKDPWGRSAGYEQGLASALLGIAANESIKTGEVIQVDSLVPLQPGKKRLSDLI